MTDKKERTLRAAWDKRERDVMYHFPRKCDGGLLHYAFGVADVCEGRSLRDELKLRGYDITTLKFSIERFPPAAPPPVVMARLGAENVDADGRPVEP